MRKTWIWFGAILLLIPFAPVSFGLYLALTLVASAAGGLLIGRRWAACVALGTLAVFGLAKAWCDVYVFNVKPHSHPNLITDAALNLTLALVCAGVTAAGVRAHDAFAVPRPSD